MVLHPVSLNPFGQEWFGDPIAGAIAGDQFVFGERLKRPLHGRRTREVVRPSVGSAEGLLAGIVGQRLKRQALRLRRALPDAGEVCPEVAEFAGPDGFMVWRPGDEPIDWIPRPQSRRRYGIVRPSVMSRHSVSPSLRTTSDAHVAIRTRAPYCLVWSDAKPRSPGTRDGDGR